MVTKHDRVVGDYNTPGGRRQPCMVVEVIVTVFDAHDPPVRQRPLGPPANVPALCTLLRPSRYEGAYGRQRFVVDLVRKPSARVTASNVGHPFAKGPAQSSANRSHIVKTRR